MSRAKSILEKKHQSLKEAEAEASKSKGELDKLEDQRDKLFQEYKALGDKIAKLRELDGKEDEIDKLSDAKQINAEKRSALSDKIRDLQDKHESNKKKGLVKEADDKNASKIEAIKKKIEQLANKSDAMEPKFQAEHEKNGPSAKYHQLRAEDEKIMIEMVKAKIEKYKLSGGREASTLKGFEKSLADHQDQLKWRLESAAKASKGDKSEAHDPKEVASVLTALNSTGGAGSDKYPFGNKELTAKAKSMEQSGLISYDDKYGKWSKGKK